MRAKSLCIFRRHSAKSSARAFLTSGTTGSTMGSVSLMATPRAYRSSGSQKLWRLHTECVRLMRCALCAARCRWFAGFSGQGQRRDHRIRSRWPGAGRGGRAYFFAAEARGCLNWFWPLEQDGPGWRGGAQCGVVTRWPGHGCGGSRRFRGSRRISRRPRWPAFRPGRGGC